MSLAKLIATMEDRGVEEVTEIRRACRVQAVDLAHAANVSRKQRLADATAASISACKSKSSMVVARARRESYADVIRARSNAVERVWNTAREMLTRDDIGERWQAIIADHVQEALTFLEREEPVVCCAPNAERAVRDALDRAGLRLAIRADDVVEIGVVVTSKDERVIIDNTLLARLERLRNKSLPEINRVLDAAVDQGGIGAPLT